MSTTTTTITQAAPSLSVTSQPKLKVDGTDPKFGDWRDDLIRDGYAVVKGAIPRDRALGYADKMFALAESL